jgi:N-acyl-D-amino-acid deacylase
MADNAIPGAAVTFLRDGETTYATALGWANVEAREPVTLESRFRIGSVSKPLTAAAILNLVAEDKLTLDDKAFEILAHLSPLLDGKPDPRLGQVTIEHLLRHVGGWDRGYRKDPLLRERTRLVARIVQSEGPPSPEDLVRFYTGRPLDLSPGTRYAYSNFGYVALGRVIETAAGVPYDAYMREAVLAPLEITGIALGHTRPEDRPEAEVHYYDQPATDRAPSLYPPHDPVPWPDGGFSLETLDAALGWTATAPALARLTHRLLTPAPEGLLPPALIDAQRTPPPKGLWFSEDAYYGLGWRIRPREDATPLIWHPGTLPGATALTLQQGAITWTILMNSRPPNWETFNEALLGFVTVWTAEAGDTLALGLG